MEWAIVGAVVLLLIVVASIRSRRARERAQVGAPRDLSHMADGARLIDATGAPITESHTIQVH